MSPTWASLGLTDLVTDGSARSVVGLGVPEVAAIVAVGTGGAVGRGGSVGARVAAGGVRVGGSAVGVSAAGGTAEAGGARGAIARRSRKPPAARRNTLFFDVLTPDSSFRFSLAAAGGRMSSFAGPPIRLALCEREE